MRKLAICLLLECAIAQAQQPHSDTVSNPPLAELAKLNVSICGTPAYPPVSWVTPDGRVEGVNTAIIRALLEPLGVHIDDQQNSNWRRCLKEAELGNVDVLTGFKNIERQRFVTYLDTPIIDEAIYLYYPVNHPVEYSSWKDLAGLRVGVLRGDSFGDKTDAALRQYLQLELVSTQNQNLLKLADGRLDAVPMGKLSGQLMIRALGLTGKIGYTATDVDDYWYVAISKKSPLIQWLPELNARLKEIFKQPNLIPELLAEKQTLYLQTMATKADEVEETK